MSYRHSGKPHTALFNIPLNEEGVPIPPHVEVLETSIVQLATLLDEYLLSLWSKCFDVVVRKCLETEDILDFSQSTGAGAPTSPIPWDQISRNPDGFFDTAVYKLPCALQAPEILKSEPVSTITLYQYFSKISVSQPFQFRSRKGVSQDLCNPDDNDDDGGIETLPNPRPSSSSAPTAALSEQATHCNLTSVNTNPLTSPTTSPALPPILGHHVPSSTMMAPPTVTAAPSQPVTMATVTAAPPPVETTATIPPEPVATTHANAPANSDVPIVQKKGKGRGRPGVKSKRPTSERHDTVGDDPSRRTSTRTVELKRKQPVSEAIDTTTGPVKKKRTTLKDRWFYAGGEGTQA